MIDPGVPDSTPIPIIELGVAEAYEFLVRLGQADLPPLDAIENEDWGRDWLLSRVAALPAATLAELNLTWDADESG